ncbi:MAG: hypothetical protein M1336_04205 [Deltaproteobacteria bacterium]|nr:hypothetical protein [Deltaproteobacteria bacterium]
MMGNPAVGHASKRAMLALAAVLICAGLFSGSAQALAKNEGTILLTVFLRHDQSKTLDQIQAELRRNGFYQKFPPKGIEVVSWYVMMGIGQVVTLRVPADRLREVNLSLEHSAWGAFRTEFFATYDFKPVWEAERAKAERAKP